MSESKPLIETEESSYSNESIKSVASLSPDSEQPSPSDSAIDLSSVSNLSSPTQVDKSDDGGILLTANEENKNNSIVVISEDDDEAFSDGSTPDESVVNGSLQFTVSAEKSKEIEQGTQVSLQVNKSCNREEASVSGEESDVEDNDKEGSPGDTDVPNHHIDNDHSPTVKRLPPSIKLPDTVTRLEAPNGNILYLVGTIHFSKESQNDVATTIRLVKPDIVVVELCKARTAILSLDEETILRESSSLDFGKIRRILTQHGTASGILYLLLLSMSVHLTKQLGLAPGGEFRTAFREFYQLQNERQGDLSSKKRIILGDRPINVTLARALSSLSLWQKVKIAWHFITSNTSMSKEEVEKFKEKDFVAEMLEQMTGSFPGITEIFVRERNVYLTLSLQNSIYFYPDGSPDSETRTQTAVGVVGLAHVAGIVECWGNVTNRDIGPIMVVPPPTLTSKIMKKGLKWSLYSALGYGIYKCLPSSAKNLIFTNLNSLSTIVKDFVSPRLI